MPFAIAGRSPARSRRCIVQSLEDRILQDAAFCIVSRSCACDLQPVWFPGWHRKTVESLPTHTPSRRATLMSTGTQTLVSASREQRNSANGPSYRPLLSRDGSTLVFKSYASDLIEHDYNQAPDLFYVSSAAPGALTSIVLLIQIVQDEVTSLRWRAVSADFYVVEYRDQLSTGEWQPLDATIIIEDNWAGVVDSLPLDTKERFYRVRFVPPAE
jgi:hypothetical protein